MTKLTVFRRQASIDSHVTLRLTRGEDVSGRITEIDDVHVCLDLGGGATITIFEDILAGWEVHQENSLAASAEEPSGHPTTEEHARTISLAEAQRSTDSGVGDDAHHEQAFGAATGEDGGNARELDSAPRTYTPAGHPEVFSLLTRVDATLSEAVKRARLAPLEPDFQFPDAEFPSWTVAEVRREWDRARNQYAYALKVREIGRLNSMVAQILEPLAKRFPGSAATRSLLGRVLMKLNRQSEAKGHLAAAATLSEAPQYWLALASVAGEDTAVECYALRKYFSMASPQHAKDAWFRYLAVATDHCDLGGIARVIRRWSEQPEVELDLRRVLSESAIYLLSSIGSRELALEVAANLEDAARGLPSGWQDEFERRASPSKELLAAENEFVEPSVPLSPAKQLIRPKEGDRVQHGRIVSFGNQRFGFIDVHWGKTFFFRIDDVTDEGLKYTLLYGDWKTSGEVEFEIRPSYGHTYRRAVGVVRLQDSESLLQRARHFMQLSQHSQAMALVRRVLSDDPADENARRTEAEIKEDIKKQLRDHGIGLPKGKGPYARAKRAQFVDQDLGEAERLLKLAVLQPDKPESAIKDLASLLNQQGRSEEAISLLESNSEGYKGISPYDSILATFFQHAGRHDDAIRVLTRLSAAQPVRKGPLLKQIAFSQFKLARYDAAERTLREFLESNPGDRTAERWLAGLEDARRGGSYAEAEELIGDLGGLAEEGIELSSLARAAIERCTFEGVDPARVQAGTVGAKEIDHVEELAKKLGPKRPRDRAAYYLSAAALLKRDIDDSKPGRIYDCLFRYFASMADASWVEKKPADVVRSYYIESLALVVDNDLYEAWRSLLLYLATFSPGTENIEATLPARGRRTGQGYVHALQKALDLVGPKTQEDWLEGLLVVGAQSSFARIAVRDAIQTSPSLYGEFANLLDSVSHQEGDIQTLWQSRCREQARNHRQRLSVCRTLTRHQATAASMEDLGKELRNAAKGTRSELDRRRLSALGDIVSSALTFCRASDFEEKERNFWQVTTQAERFRKEILDTPTQYSFDGLLPIADHLSSLIEEEYAQMARTSGADLHLKLLVDEYLRGQEGEIRLQIEISNKRGCSPASSLRICVGPSDSEYFVAEHWEREVVSTLRGGNTEVIQMVVQPRGTALEDRAFPIVVMAIYQNHLGEERHTENHAWTVRLYPDEEFQYLENRYAPFAEGGPVDDAEMFVGRDELLARLESSLLSGSGSKSIVMFGQKRAGKSSLIEHLRRRLGRNEGIVPICFSLQDIATELSVEALLHRILLGVEEVLEELRFGGRDVPDFSPPGLDVLGSHPTLRFHNAMATLIRDIKRRSTQLTFVLLIDEFTDVFKEIRKDRVPRQFMKAWKSIIEKKYFASVLVGQDIMPAFKEEFPNEFGVTEDVRVTYLDDVAATALIRKPIGEKRFAGRAISRLLDLTAGSPYYTMMFCARLVDYMNATRSVIVTEADIHAVEEEMLRGDRRLTIDKFDNLLCAGDGMVDSGIDPDDTRAVCSAIVQGSEREGWCPRELIRGFDEVALDKLLSDIETRDVAERKGTTYRLRVGLFRDWLETQG